MQPEVSDDRAESLGIHVRVARGGCDALMAQEGLDVAQVGSALVEKECRGRMPQGMSGNDRHPRTLAGELEPGVEGLVAKGRAVPARKDERASPRNRFPHPAAARLDTFQESEPFLERARQFWCEWQIAKRASFDLEAGGNKRATYRLAHQPVKGEPRPLVIPAAGKKEGRCQVVG